MSQIQAIFQKLIFEFYYKIIFVLSTWLKCVYKTKAS